MEEKASDFVLPSTQIPKRPTLEPGQERARDFRLPSLPAPTPYEKDWGSASWSEVGEGLKKEFFPSVGRAVAAIPQAIMQPGQVVEGLKQAGSGVASKVRGAFGERQDPAQKAEQEAVINAMIEPFTSVAGFKKALATDPYSVLSVAAIPISGGASLLGTGAKAVGTTTLAGRTLRGAELATKGVAGVADPIYGAIGAAGYVASRAKDPVKSAVAEVAGINKPTLDISYEAGKAASPAIKQSFNDFAKGSGRAEDFSQAVSKASQAMRDTEIKDWVSQKKNVLALKAPVPSQPVFDAINEARTMIGPRQTAFGPSLAAHKQIDALEQMMINRFSQPQRSAARTLEGFDQLKRTLYELGENSSGMTSDAIKKVNAGVRNSMSAISPEYVQLMEKYQLLNDKLKTVSKSLGTSNNVGAVQELNRFISGLNDVEKGRFIADLAKYDPRIPYMVAGATIHQAVGNPSNLTKVFNVSQLANLGWGFSRGDPYHIMAALGALGLGSPSRTAGLAYGAGTVARGVEKIADAAPAGTAEAIGTAARLAPAQLSRMQNEELIEGLRSERKSGGRVMSAQHMVAAADRAKKAISGKTEALLNSTDEHVAKALEIAKQNLEG